MKIHLNIIFPSMPGPPKVITAPYFNLKNCFNCGKMSASKYNIQCITSVARSGFLLGCDLWPLHWIPDCVLLHTVALLIYPLQHADQIQFHHTVPYYLQPHTDSELSSMLLMMVCRALKPTRIKILYYLYTVNYVITVQNVMSYYQADYLTLLPWKRTFK